MYIIVMVNDMTLRMRFFTREYPYYRLYTGQTAFNECEALRAISMFRLGKKSVDENRASKIVNASTYIRTHTHARTHAHARTRTHTHTHTHTHTNTHTYNYIVSRVRDVTLARSNVEKSYCFFS